MKTPDCNQDAMAGFAAPYGSASLPPVLDACCGSRMFWFDRKDSRAVFVDNRRESHTLPDVSSAGGSRTLEINPDIIADFTDLPFPDNSFAVVIFDPPHFEREEGGSMKEEGGSGRLEGGERVRMLERELRAEPSGGGACPKCGAQVRDPFGGRVVVHDVAGCRGVGKSQISNLKSQI